MKKQNLILFLILFVIVGIFAVLGANLMTETATKVKASTNSIHKFSAENIDGIDTSLEKFKGNVVLIVNTASKCGYTPQYKGLQAIHEKYKDQGFTVIGFPTNDFGGQEPGTNEEIKQFCTLKYAVGFPMFAKITVKGEDKHPLYKFLTDKEIHPETGGEVTWNFNKFLANGEGEIVARFSSKDEPESETVTSEIEKHLSKKEK